MLVQDQFGIIQNLIQNLQMSPIPKTSQDQFLGLDFSYSKTTLVTMVHFTTISGHFLADLFIIFHKTEALLIQND